MNNKGIDLNYIARLWEKLKLRRSYDGVFLGFNLLTYLQTQNSAFGVLIDGPADPLDDDPPKATIEPIIAGIGVVAAGIIAAFFIVKDDI